MAELPIAVQRFLDGIQTADWAGFEAYYTPEALYDATVPGWHCQYEGPERIVRELSEEWTGRNTWQIVEMHVQPFADGVVLDFAIRGWRPRGEHWPGGEVYCRLANIFRLEDGRIAEHRYYCSGEWDEATVRRIETEAPKVDRSSGASSRAPSPDAEGVAA
jgi:hypothetical protein